MQQRNKTSFLEVERVAARVENIMDRALDIELGFVSRVVLMESMIGFWHRKGSPLVLGRRARKDK